MDQSFVRDHAVELDGLLTASAALRDSVTPECIAEVSGGTIRYSADGKAWRTAPFDAGLIRPQTRNDSLHSDAAALAATMVSLGGQVKRHMTGESAPTGSPTENIDSGSGAAYSADFRSLGVVSLHHVTIEGSNPGGRFEASSANLAIVDAITYGDIVVSSIRTRGTHLTVETDIRYTDDMDLFTLGEAMWSDERLSADLRPPLRYYFNRALSGNQEAKDTLRFLSTHPDLTDAHRTLIDTVLERPPLPPVDEEALETLLPTYTDILSEWHRLG